MNQQAKYSELAAQIRAAYAGTPIAPIRPQLADLDVDGAYAIQQENTAHWEKEGRRAGKLVFSETVVEYRDQNGELVVTARGVGVRTEKPVEQ